MVAVSFVTLVCSLSMSVIIADLAKWSVEKLKRLTAYISSGCLQTFTSKWRLCILNEYSVNFVAGEHNMDTVLPPVPFSFLLLSYFCFLSTLNVTIDLPLNFLLLLTVHEGWLWGPVESVCVWGGGGILTINYIFYCSCINKDRLGILGLLHVASFCFPFFFYILKNLIQVSDLKMPFFVTWPHF